MSMSVFFIRGLRFEFTAYSYMADKRQYGTGGTFSTLVLRLYTPSSRKNKLPCELHFINIWVFHTKKNITSYHTCILCWKKSRITRAITLTTGIFIASFVCDSHLFSCPIESMHTGKQHFRKTRKRSERILPYGPFSLGKIHVLGNQLITTKIFPIDPDTFFSTI